MLFFCNICGLPLTFMASASQSPDVWTHFERDDWKYKNNTVNWGTWYKGCLNTAVRLVHTEEENDPSLFAPRDEAKIQEDTMWPFLLYSL